MRGNARYEQYLCRGGSCTLAGNSPLCSIRRLADGKVLGSRLGSERALRRPQWLALAWNEPQEVS